MSLSVQEKVLGTHPVIATVCSLLDDKTVIAASRVKNAFQGHTAWVNAREVSKMAIARPLHSCQFLPTLKTAMIMSGIYPGNICYLCGEFDKASSLSEFDGLLRKHGERSDDSTVSTVLANYEEIIACWNDSSFPEIKFTVKDWVLLKKFKKAVASLDGASPNYESEVLAIYRRIMGSAPRNFGNLYEMKR